MLMAALLVTACATLTPEEKAARDAAVKEGVKAAVASQKFKINVTSVTPMRGTNRSLSGAFIKLDSTTVECFLPYAGRDDIPHMKTRGEVRMSSKIEIRGEVRDYLMGIDPADERAVVSFTASDLGVDYKLPSPSRTQVVPRFTLTPTSATISTTRDTSSSRNNK